MNPSASPVYAPDKSPEAGQKARDAYASACREVAGRLALKKGEMYSFMVRGCGGRCYGLTALFDGYSSDLCGSAVFIHPEPFMRAIPRGINYPPEEKRCETLAVPTVLITEAELVYDNPRKTPGL